ncbi:MAG: hypothetical protein HZR80_16915 [Candidatus Heimdallarchaeota archaeon]
MQKLRAESDKLEEKLKVLTTQVNLNTADITAIKEILRKRYLEVQTQEQQKQEVLAKEKRDEETIQRYQEQRESIPQKQEVIKQVVAGEKTLILEVEGKTADGLTLEDVCGFFQNGNFESLCDSKQKVKLFGQLDSLTKSTTNPATGKTIPAKITLKDSTGRKFRGVVWSKTAEDQLTQLLQCWLVFDSVYFKQIQDQYISKDFHIFERLNKLANRLERNQYEFQVNKCRILHVKLKSAKGE